MITLEWTILAQGYSIDRETGSVSIFRMIDEITLPNAVPDHQPAAPVPITMPVNMLHQWTRSDAESGAGISARVKILDPGRNQLAEAALVIAFDNALKARTVATLAAMPFTVPGDYRIVTELEKNGAWEERGVLILPIKRL
jgi:hypothetical protein